MVTETKLDDYITVREAAKECGRSPETVRRWVWSGKLMAKKLGNQLYIRKTDLAPFCLSIHEAKRIRRLAALNKALELQERIRKRIGGNIDILEALDRSRESHP